GQEPALYNQAIMEFGALHCKPKSPLCGVCPIRLDCYAFKHKKVDLLPIKQKKIKIRERWLNYFVGIYNGEILTKQRQPGDVWQHLYDFPLIETLQEVSNVNADLMAEIVSFFGENVQVRFIENKKHILTHQIIYVQFFAIDNYIVNFNQH